MQIFKDLSTAVKIAKEIRRARCSGTDEVRVQTVRRMQTIDIGEWPWTMEASYISLISNDCYAKLEAVFLTFDKATRHALTFPPEAGGFPDRLALWRKQLKSTLPHKDACFLAQILARRYISAKRRRSIAAKQKGGEQK